MKADSIYLQTQHHDFQQLVRNFLQDHVIDLLPQWEQDRKIPLSVWRRMGEAGLLGLQYSPSEGGLGKDFFHAVVFLQELGRTGSVGFRVAIAVHAYMATSYLNALGSLNIKNQYLRPAILGEKIIALALTERHAGSDLSQMATTAEDNDLGYYLLNGTKRYVVNGTAANYFIVAARTSPCLRPGDASGISLFVVDATLPGVQTAALDMLGWQCGDVAEIQFKDVHVSRSNLLGQHGQGFFYLMKYLQAERLVAAILALGGIEHCLEITAAYLKQRQLFARQLSEFQAVRHKMAVFYAKTHALREHIYHVAWLHEQQKSILVESAMIKYQATELANEVAAQCLQFFGARGYENHSAIARIFKDTKAASITAGTNEVMLDLIATMLL